MLDGITIYGYPAIKTWGSQALYRDVDADVYHTEEPFIGTYLAQRALPHKAHVITFRNPRTPRDWWTKFRYPERSRSRVIATSLYYDNPLVWAAVRRADAWGIAADFLREKVARKYGDRIQPIFLPSPVTIPDTVEKAGRPTVCFVSRLDRIKRPEVFFDLARRHPDVSFIAVGSSQNDAYAKTLLSDLPRLPNLTLPGFIDQFHSDELSKIFAKSWILVNTAAIEGLPNAFIEAAAHGCAILSTLDPESFTTRFGHLVQGGDYSAGLSSLLHNDRWRERGQAGRTFVRERFSNDVVIDRHIALYETVA